MRTAMKKSMVVGDRKCTYRYALALSITLGFVVCLMPPDVHAGGVRFGFGVDVPFPGPAVAPPVMYAPPVVVERAPRPVVVERTPPPVMVEETAPPVVVTRTPPPVVYEGPVVVERRSTVYYYPQSYQYRSHPVETEREYYRQRSRSWETDDAY